ncbi:MAG: adenine-specific methyltransferase EcoRI family protein [Clostridiales bacterium]|nr:adenine-specific methyltransferase EcoRI family protein [Clostridiales bacterium]
MVKTADLINSDLWRIFPVINVDYVSDIPSDYPGAMAVPITFIFRYDQKQFELLGQTPSGVRLENGKKHTGGL